MNDWQRYGVRHPVRVAILCGFAGGGWTAFNDFGIGWAIFDGVLLAAAVLWALVPGGYLARKFPIEHQEARRPDRD